MRPESIAVTPALTVMTISTATRRKGNDTMAKYTVSTVAESDVTAKRAVQINGPADAAKVLAGVWKPHGNQEGFYAITLSTKNTVLGVNLVSLGSLNASIVHPREIFFHAIGCKDCGRKPAASIILAHNHPSGDPAPSKEDIEFTKRFAECGELMGIQLLDHVILGDNGRYCSLKEKGIF